MSEPHAPVRLELLLEAKKVRPFFWDIYRWVWSGEVTDQSHQEARRDGVFAGVTSGLTAGEQDPSPLSARAPVVE